MIQVSDEFGGWWHQGDVGTEPLFYVGRNLRFGPNWDARAADVRAVLSLTSAGSPVHLLLGLALLDLEQDITAGGEA